jgi:hypothetical protein
MAYFVLVFYSDNSRPEKGAGWGGGCQKKGQGVEKETGREVS